MATVDLNGFFVFLGCVAFGLTILGCVAIYFGFKLKFRGEEFEIKSGRYDQESLAEKIKEEKLLKEMQVPERFPDDLEEDMGDVNDKKNNNRGKKSFH
jgi:hypothetical protein